MIHPTRKMSEIMKQMSERLLRHPDAAHSSEAAHVALMFANIAWNESVGRCNSTDWSERVSGSRPSVFCGKPANYRAQMP